MSLLSRKGLLAIAAVVDVALIAHERPLSARALAARHNLPPRHLEPVLQALVHEGILRGIRGPRGGYELARDRRRISLEDILRAAGSVDEPSQDAMPASQILSDIVMPAVLEAEQAFSASLAQITVEDLTHRAGGRGERGRA
ncbi:MAG: Rrf2 family transcriptional regulator [Xanthobacteraceae bacterium]|nr:Rrf2 family transcriptional regulator [Xanthobacteraceae bacterium]PWB60602.1 MAG: Rrf2 family transcriptional regulator [Bradyrhizobiaceae bacterium]